MQMVIHMNAIKAMLQTFQTIHPQTKRMLRICAGYILVILTACTALCLLAGRGVDYYAAMRYARDLFAAIRPCVGVTALGGLLIEGALHAE